MCGVGEMSPKRIKIKFNGDKFFMSNPKKYKISVEVLKYTYCGKSIESDEFFSEKICCSTIKVRKKLSKKLKGL
jgi:hypothetical protein